MPRLPRLSGREAVSVPGFPETPSVRDPGELQAGTLGALIRNAGLAVERLEGLLSR